MCKEEISTQEKQVDFISSILQSLFFVVDGRRRLVKNAALEKVQKELKTADEEKALLEKSVPKSTRYMSQSGLLIFLHSGKMQG